MGSWPRSALSSGREIGGKPLGLVGFGSFAQAGVRAQPPDELVAAADVVSLHLPLLASTRGLFGAARIAQMKPGAMLVNTSRGGIVDEPALAAALDVFDAEPLPASAPFADCPNLLLTPHIAGVTAESNQRVSQLIAERVLEALR